MTRKRVPLAARKLFEFRLGLGLTQKEAGEELGGLSGQCLSLLERGEASPTPDTRRRIENWSMVPDPETGALRPEVPGSAWDVFDPTPKHRRRGVRRKRSPDEVRPAFQQRAVS